MQVSVLSTMSQCKNNLYLTKKILNFFNINNIIITKKPNIADYIIITTCGFKKECEEKSLRIINHKLKLNKKLIITGCLPKMIPEKLIHKNIITINYQEFYKFNKIFKPNIEFEKIPGNFTQKKRDKYLDGYYIKICEGCINNCSYCRIKIAKGNVKSKKIKEIIKEFKIGLNLKNTSFVLIGDDCGSYGKDINTDLSKLINAIDKSTSSFYMVKIYYLYPGELFNFYKNINKDVLKKIKLINIPLQSTSKKILNSMNRNYDIDKIKHLIKKIKKYNPKIILKTHMIFGFPGETRNDLIDYKKLTKYFDQVIFFLYSDYYNLYKKDNIDFKELKYRFSLIYFWSIINKKIELQFDLLKFYKKSKLKIILILKILIFFIKNKSAKK